MLKYLLFVNNVVDLSFLNFDFNVFFFLVSRSRLLFLDLDLACLLELRQNHAMKKEDLKETMKVLIVHYNLILLKKFVQECFATLQESSHSLTLLM